MMTRVLGIDPGLTGAYALLESTGELIEAGDLPTIGEGAQRRIDGATFAALVHRLAPAVAVVEEVSALPKQGVSGMFRFGRAVGGIEGVILGAGVRLERVAPSVWKRHFRLAGKANGSGEPSRQRAIERWPRAAAVFARKKDHNRADSALIGLWFVEARSGFPKPSPHDPSRPGGTDAQDIAARPPTGDLD